MKKILFIILISTFFISCSSTFNKYTKKVSSYFISNPKTIDFLEITNELTSDICEKITPNNILYITDYVNEKDLKNNSQFGFLLANQTKVNILKEDCSKKIEIQDLQLANSLRISKNGSRILTRDFKKIKNKNLQDDRQILIGSYLFTNKQIIFFLKLVNLNNGNIVATTTTSRLINDEYKALEGYKTKKELKELEEAKIYTPMHL